MPAMERHGYIQSGAGALYATVFEASLPPARVALVLVPPFGEEAKSTVRLYTRLARALAEAGCLSVRLDLCGSGDSSGDHASITWQDWLNDLQNASDILPGSSSTPWAFLGTRLGGTLAAEAVPLLHPSGLLLIEPVPEGEAYLEELTRRRAIRAMMSGTASDQADPAAQWEAGECVDFGAFPVQPSLAADLRRRDLGRSLAALPADLALALFRIAPTDRLSATWSALFDTVRSRPRGTAEVLRDKAFWGQVDYYESEVLISRILRWIDIVYPRSQD